MTLPGLVAVHAFVNGEWREGPLRHRVSYSYDGRDVAHVEETSSAEVSAAVHSAVAAQRKWRNTPAFRRAELLTEIGYALQKRRDALVEALVLNSSKTLRESRAEVERSLSTLAVTAEEAKRIGGEVVPMDALPAGAGRFGVAVRVPVGVVAGITPFNAPLNLAIHKLGPAIAAGNAFVLKPHPHGGVVTNLLAGACSDAGLPAGLFNVVHGGPDVGRALVSHRDVALVSFTGSGVVGEQITREIGLKRSVMELGGNAPTIVHADASLPTAITACADAAFALGGQSCVSTQRLYVHRSIAEPFLAGLVASARGRRLGDPMEAATDLAPLIDERAAERVESWIAEAVQAGARLACGGWRRGAAIEATVLTDVQPSMRVVCEEIFGPVVTVSMYDAIDEAIAAANASPWGFKVGIFTNSIDVALHAARELEFGTIAVNGASRSRVDHEPSGGTKASGWGREGPRYAIEDMTHVRMISLTSVTA